MCIVLSACANSSKSDKNAGGKINYGNLSRFHTPYANPEGRDFEADREFAEAYKKQSLRKNKKQIVEAAVVTEPPDEIIPGAELLGEFEALPEKGGSRLDKMYEGTAFVELNTSDIPQEIKPLIEKAPSLELENVQIDTMVPEDSSVEHVDDHYVGPTKKSSLLGALSKWKGNQSKSHDTHYNHQMHNDQSSVHADIVLPVVNQYPVEKDGFFKRNLRALRNKESDDCIIEEFHEQEACKIAEIEMKKIDNSKKKAMQNQKNRRDVVRNYAQERDLCD